MSGALARLGHDAGAAALTMTAVLGSLATALVLREQAGLPAQIPVLAVVLALTLNRATHEGLRQILVAAVEVPALALAAAGVGWLVFHEPWLGQSLLVVGLSAGILARRYGPAVRHAGRLIALPFLALLVTPLPAAPDSARSSVLWSPVVALIALAWTVGVSLLARKAFREKAKSGTTDRPPGAVAPSSIGSSRGKAARRLDPPTRMALQMATGLAVAFVAGHLLFGHRWAWTVLSAFLVASGNRGRGDVVLKAGLRVSGALIGTVLATLIGGSLPSGHRGTLVALFAVMAVSLVLRPRGYAWWAAGVTAMVALLHAYYGQSGTGLLGERLVGVLVGSAIGVVAAWFVTPIRTRDVFRRRVADCLAALTDDLTDDLSHDLTHDRGDDRAGGPGTGAGPRFPAALARLDELSPTLRLRARAPRPAGEIRLIEAVTALHGLELPPDTGGRRRLRAAVVRVRRALAGRDDPDPDQLPPALATVHRALRTTTRVRESIGPDEPVRPPASDHLGPD